MYMYTYIYIYIYISISILPNEGCELNECARAGPLVAADRASLNAPASRLGRLGRLGRSPGPPRLLARGAWDA